MKSLTDLNTYSATSINYTDYRSPKMTFAQEEVINQTMIEFSGNTLTKYASPGIDLLVLHNVSATFTLDLTHVPDTIVMWPSPLQGNLASSTVGNVYSMTNIETISDWNLIKSPIIYSTTVNNNAVFSSTVSSSLGSKTWTTAIVAITPTELTIAKNDNAYTSGNATIATGNPTLTSITLPT